MKYDLDLSHGADPTLAALIGTLQDGTREWRESLELPPVEAVVWQPREGSYSIGGILLHMIDCEGYWLKAFTEGIEPDVQNPANTYNSAMDQYTLGGWPPPPSQPIEWYFELQDAMRGEIIQRVVTHQQAMKEFSTPRNSFTYQWIVAHIVQHDSYHGGQCVMLHELWKMQTK